MFISQISESKYKKRQYFIFLITAFIMLAVMKTIAVYSLANYPDTISILILTLDNLIALTLSIFVASLAYIFFTPNNIREGDIHIVPSYDLESELEKIIEDTETYYYAGHTARWNRSVTLKKLKTKAKLKNTRIEISFIILDPSSEKVCLYYAEFGHASRKNSSQIDNVKNVKIELITTILICAKYKIEPLLDIKIYLTDKVSLFRLDISDTGAILTKADPKEPALAFPKDTFFYRSYKEEFKVTRDQSRSIALERLPSAINTVSYKEYIEKIGIDTEGMTNEDWDNIIKEMEKPTSPY